MLISSGKLKAESGKFGPASQWLAGLCIAAAILLPAVGYCGQPKVTLVAVGDVLFARGVGKQITKHGAKWLFANVKGTIKGADIAFFNLECTLSTGGVVQRRRFQFRADPKLAGVLSASGFDVACLANNHTLDYGREAMMDTVRAVRKAGMAAVGAGKDRADALKLQIVKRNGLRVGFLAYTDLPTDGVVRLADRPTVAGLNPDELPAQIKSARKRCDALVVSFHWGVEYMKRPTERQQHIAHVCIDNGADVVLGHHPHVLQPTETYKGRPIIYSMGAFVWDAKIFGADKSAIYTIEMGKGSARLVKSASVRIKGCRPLLCVNISASKRVK